MLINDGLAKTIGLFLSFAVVMLYIKKINNKEIKTIPSNRPIFESIQSSQNIKEIKNRYGISVLMICFFITTGLITELIPSTRAMLITLLPNIFPMDIPPEPLTAATRLTSNSGAEVAKETMVRPIITGLTANMMAVVAAPSTSSVDPIKSRTKPRISMLTCINNYISSMWDVNLRFLPN